MTPATDSPEAVARAWVEAVMDRGDMAAAWVLTDPDLRLVLAQHWIISRQGDPALAGYEPDALARDLAASSSPHPLWDRFASDRLRRWRQFWAGFGTQTWDVADETQRLMPGVVVVTFMEKHRLLGWAKPGPPAATRRFAVRSTPRGWLVAGLDGSALFRPGWPPTQVAVTRGG